MLYRDEAIVLRTHKLGEADRIITLLTRQHGRVRAAVTPRVVWYHEQDRHAGDANLG